MKNKFITIPDRIFHKIWNLALDSDSFIDYYNVITSSKSEDFIDMQKYGFDIDSLYDTLKMIYDVSKLTIIDFLNKYGIKKASLSHRFCIPIRTVENWCNGNAKCSPYIIIMILEGYNIRYLPEHVYTQSQFDFKVSQKKNVKKFENEDKSILNKQKKGKVPIDDIDDLLDNINLESFSVKDFEQTHSIDNSAFLAETDYLRKHMK